MVNELIKYYWDRVRERVLERDLPCNRYMLALNDDDDYKFIAEFELFLADIEELEYSCEKGDEDNIVKAYEQFRTDLQSCLIDPCSSQIPNVEACAIALAWLIVLQANRI